MLAMPIVYYINARHIRKTIPAKSKYYFMVLGFAGVIIYNLTNNSFYIEGFWEYAGLMYAMKYHLVREGKLLDGCRTIRSKQPETGSFKSYQY
jgi:hypothetical protein